MVVYDEYCSLCEKDHPKAYKDFVQEEYDQFVNFIIDSHVMYHLYGKRLDECLYKANLIK